MALTDADRLQIVSMALMRHSVIRTGGNAPATPTEKEVNFYDYDGTLVAGYTIAEAQTLGALPSAPDHSTDDTPRTFKNWDHTLAEVNATTTTLDIGAMYVTADGWTVYDIELTAISGLSPTLYFNKSDGSTLSVDWGDGNTSTFTNTGNFNTGAHTYASAGAYSIKTKITSGSGTYGFGNGSASTVTVGGSTAAYRQTLKRLFVGEGVVSIGNYAFQNCFSLETVSLTDGITSIGQYSFSYCYSLEAIVIPSGTTTVGASAFYYCTSLDMVSIPSSVTTLGSSAFTYCSNLSSIVLGSGITYIGVYTLQHCYSLYRCVILGAVTRIDNAAFQYCYSLRAITIPNSVTGISAGAFGYCYSLRIFILQRTSPPTLANTNAFLGIPSIRIIYVPADSLSAYQSATYWTAYANYMKGY